MTLQYPIPIILPLYFLTKPTVAFKASSATLTKAAKKSSQTTADAAVTAQTPK